jgi:uncharacterized protein YwgA
MHNPVLDKRMEYDKAARIIRDAGGRVVGRTRLQKVAYLLELANLGDGFSFHYRHYGPYSEQLSQATELADLFGLIAEEERPTSWGGTYSIYSFVGNDASESSEVRRHLASSAVEADPIELELATTAAFLKAEGETDPWGETLRRKPDKAEQDRLAKAKALYKRLRIASEERLPEVD